jgi:hypothetical protein
MVTIRTVEDAYQMALKAEEKLSRKQGQRGRGRSQPRGKAVAQERTQKPKEDWKRPQGKAEKRWNLTAEQRQQYAEPRRQQDDQGGGYADANTFLVPEVEEEAEEELSHVLHVEKTDTKPLTVQTGRWTEEKLTSLRRRGVMLRAKMQTAEDRLGCINSFDT